MEYLASPYSHSDHAVVEGRFRAVCRHAADLMRNGHHVFSPIAHTGLLQVLLGLPSLCDLGFECTWRMCCTVMCFSEEFGKSDWYRAYGLQKKWQSYDGSGRKIGGQVTDPAQEAVASVVQQLWVGRCVEYDAGGYFALLLGNPIAGGQCVIFRAKISLALGTPEPQTRRKTCADSVDV